MFLVGLLVVLVLPGWLRGRGPLGGQSMSIEDDAPDLAGRPAPSAPVTGQSPVGPPYLTAVSANRRYFLDQYGSPFLVRGDSPWALMTRLRPQEAGLYFSTRQRQGFNSAIVSLLGAVGNGGPSDDGRTVDGLRPFVDGDVTRWDEAYWQRVHDYLRTAADHGITVFLYPVDGWVIGQSFRPASVDQCRVYGDKVARRLRDLPNIAWMTGGDYFPGDEPEGSDVDRCLNAMVSGIRDAGDRRPFSIQLWYEESNSTDSAFWAPRVDWSFAYSYYPTYAAVLDGYRREPVLPVLFGEGNYEGENNQGETPATTDETLRRQVLWALTSGAAGEFMGSDDWEFHDGWQQRLATPAVDQVGRLRSLVAGLPWWELVPDLDEPLVTAGRGTRVEVDEALDVLQSDYVTAARTPDGRYAVVYVPSRRTITVASALLAAQARWTWVDPVSGRERGVDPSGPIATPGVNDGGDNDWLLVARS